MTPPHRPWHLLAAVAIAACEPGSLEVVFRVPAPLAVTAVEFSVVEPDGQPGEETFDCDALAWGEVDAATLERATTLRLEAAVGGVSTSVLDAQARKLVLVNGLRDGVVVASGCGVVVGTSPRRLEVEGEPVLLASLSSRGALPEPLTLSVRFTDGAGQARRDPVRGRWRRFAAGEAELPPTAFEAMDGALDLALEPPAWSGPLRVDVTPRWSPAVHFEAMLGPTELGAAQDGQREYLVVRTAPGRQELYAIDASPQQRLVRLAEDGGWVPTAEVNVQDALAFALPGGAGDGLVLRQGAGLRVVEGRDPSVERLRVSVGQPSGQPMLLTAVGDCEATAALLTGRDGGRELRSLTDGSRVLAHPLLDDALASTARSGGCVSDAEGGAVWVNPLEAANALHQTLLFPDGGQLAWLAADGYTFLGEDDGRRLLAAQPELTGGALSLVTLRLSSASALERTVLRALPEELQLVATARGDVDGDGHRDTVALLHDRVPVHQLLVALGTQDGGVGATGLAPLGDLGEARLFIARGGGAADVLVISSVARGGGSPRLRRYAFGPRSAP